MVESDHLKVPFVWGLLRPRLILPPWARQWPSERIEAVLHHELAHIKRRDLLSQFMAQVACCMYWVNPLSWLTERRLFIERERACEALVGESLALPAYEQVLKASHSFNLLDARKAISVTERARYIGRIRDLARAVAQAYYQRRETLGFPRCRDGEQAA